MGVQLRKMEVINYETARKSVKKGGPNAGLHVVLVIALNDCDETRMILKLVWS